MSKKRPNTARDKQLNKSNDKKEIQPKKKEEEEEFIFALKISDKYNSLLDIPELIFIIDVSSDMIEYINKIRIEIISQIVSFYSFHKLRIKKIKFSIVK